MSSLGSILIRPVVSEKMTKQTERLSQYAFIVAENANRIQIARAVEDFYGVRVESVNTMRYEGKRRSRITKRGVFVGRTNSYKKAVVKLRKGDVIDFFSNI